MAYEADLNGWLNDEKENFEYARKNLYYRNLISEGIYFYEKKYEYSLQETIQHPTKYISREEFLKYINDINRIIKKMKSDKSDDNLEDLISLMNKREVIISDIEERISY